LGIGGVGVERVDEPDEKLPPMANYMLRGHGKYPLQRALYKAKAPSLTVVRTSPSCTSQTCWTFGISCYRSDSGPPLFSESP
jgi:hypothetical protein